MAKAQTVGDIIEMLEKFPKGTEVINSCGACHKGEISGFIKVSDMTKQTYGYIEITFNKSWEGSK